MRLGSRPKEGLALAATVAIVGAAVFVRFATLGWQSLWGDEGYSWSVAHAGPAAFFAPEFVDRSPALYYLLLHPWIDLRPGSEFWLRFPSAVASAGFLALVAWLAHRWIGPTAAPWAALFVAFSSFELLLAQDARVYSLLQLVWLASVALFVEGHHRRSAPILLVAGFLNATLPALHAIGLVVAGVHLVLIAAMLHSDPTTRRNRALQYALCGGVLLAVAFTFAFAGRLLATVGQGAPSAEIPHLRNVRDALVATSSGIVFAPKVVPGGEFLRDPPERTGTILSMLLWGGAVAGIARRLRPPAARPLALPALAVSLFTPPLVLALSGRMFAIPLWAPKLFSVETALVAIGLAGFVRDSAVWRRTFAATILGLGLLNGSIYFSSWKKGIGQELRAAAGRRLQPSDAVVVSSGQAPLALFYLPGSRVWFVGDDRAPEGSTWVREIRLGGPERAPLRRNAQPCSEVEVKHLWIWPSALPAESALARVPLACRRDAAVFAWSGGAWRRLAPPSASLPSTGDDG